WNNQGYGEIKKYMLNRAIEPVGVDIYTPDLIGAATALGCTALAVEGEAQLRAALASAADRQGPTVIEIDEQHWQQTFAL
ncbi:thiamine pyrophosphate-dependent enzyme, partial [Rhizobium sp. SIMBA_035]